MEVRGRCLTWKGSAVLSIPPLLLHFRHLAACLRAHVYLSCCHCLASLTSVSSAEAPFISRVISAKYLTTPDSIKQTGFLELEVPASLSFEAGDAFGMVRWFWHAADGRLRPVQLCHNPPKLVSSLLALFPDENADAEFHYGASSLVDAFAHL